MTSAGTIGTLRRPETRATAEPTGSLLSRAIENSIRIVAVWTARQQTKIAIAASARNTFPVVLPNACLITYGRPSSPMFLSRRFLLDRIAEQDHEAADQSGRRDRADDRRRRVLARVVGLLGERPGGVEPVHHVRAHDPADEQRAEVAPRVAGAEAVGVDDDLRSVVQVEQQQDDQRGVEPISSAITPTLLIRDISLTPSMLMIVVMAIRIAPSSSAFCAPPLVLVVPASAALPKNWKLAS